MASVVIAPITLLRSDLPAFPLPSWMLLPSHQFGEIDNLDMCTSKWTVVNPCKWNNLNYLLKLDSKNLNVHSKLCGMRYSSERYYVLLLPIQKGFGLKTEFIGHLERVTTFHTSIFTHTYTYRGGYALKLVSTGASSLCIARYWLPTANVPFHLGSRNISGHIYQHLIYTPHNDWTASILTHYLTSQIKVKATVSRPVSSHIRSPSETRDKFFSLLHRN